MSDSDSNAEIIAGVASIQIENIFELVALALIIYEFMITFSKEVELFWKRKFTLSSVLFLVNRYVPFVVNMICKVLGWTAECLKIFQYLPWASFAGLRAYVLGSRAWLLAVFVFMLSLAPVVINYVTLGYTVPYLDPIYGCGSVNTLTDMEQQEACLITSDLLILVMTWTEVKLLGQSTSLSGILFRDGVVYFIVLLILNVLHLTFSLLSILNLNNVDDNASYLPILTEPMTAVLISRFLIDLQEANNDKHQQHSLSSIQLGQIGSLDLNRFIGSICSSVAAPGEASPEHDPQQGLDLDSDQSAAEGDGGETAEGTADP